MRRRTLDGLDHASPAELLQRRTDGRVKMFVMLQALKARAEFRELYEDGEYVALDALGARRECLFAFARTRSGAERELRAMTITCVPRLAASLVPDGSPPVGTYVWKDTRVELPRLSSYDPANMSPFRNIFTGETIVPEHDGRGLSIAAATLFDQFPVAVLVPCST